MRDYHKLRAFQLADQLVLEVYRASRSFPNDERFGLTSQLRRAAISVASNIVEGCARSTEADYLRFLDIAYGSSCELEYQLSVCIRLGFLEKAEYLKIVELCAETSKVLNGLIRSLRRTHNLRPEA